DRGNKSTWPDVMRELHRLLPMPIYADDYLVCPAARDRHGIRHPDLPDKTPPFPSLNGLSLARGLDVLCRHFHRLWWTDGISLYFRSRTWFIERQYEVPQSVLDVIQTALSKNDEIDISTLVTLSALSSKQLAGLRRIMANVAAGDD